MACFVIAEAGVNHNGDVRRAMAMVDAAAAFGADAIKFQTFTAEKLTSRHAVKADYQKLQTGDGSQFDMVKKLELDHASHRLLAERCASQGIEFMSTAFDLDSHAMLLRLGIKRIKIPSGELTNWPLIRGLLSTDLPIILSTGMATMDEIVDTVDFIDRTRRAMGFDAPLGDRLTIMHCTSNYPAALEEVNLRAMISIARECAVPIGYSDHTLGITVATAAVALGARVIEKHFTLDKSLLGPDHAASILPDEFAEMIVQIRSVETALGSDIKAPTAAEVGVKAVARRSVAAASSLATGHVLTEDDLMMIRPGTGISPRDIDRIVGRPLRRDVAASVLLQWDDIG